MSIFDLIGAMRTKEASPEKAARATNILAVICAAAGVWNSAITYIMPAGRMPVTMPHDFPAVSLTAGMLLAALFFLAGRGIADRAAWGKRLGQLSIILLVAAIIMTCYSFFSRLDARFPVPPVPILVIFSIVFLAQFIVPAFFGIRYLGRLPVYENSYARPEMRPDQVTHAPEKSASRTPAIPMKSYKEAPVPFGVIGTFAISVAVPLICTMAAMQYGSPEAGGLLFGVLFIATFLGPVLYNRKPSGFEQARTVLASYTGGGSMLLFHGSWPFFRLLVYDDGVEIRVEYHRFFIPYDKMEDLPDKVKFFSLGGILFISDLPGVPSRIRFHSRNTKETLAFVNEQRRKFLMR